jgi:hypothetical protein
VTFSFIVLSNTASRHRVSLMCSECLHQVQLAIWGYCVEVNIFLAKKTIFLFNSFYNTTLKTSLRDRSVSFKGAAFPPEPAIFLARNIVRIIFWGCTKNLYSVNCYHNFLLKTAGRLYVFMHYLVLLIFFFVCVFLIPLPFKVKWSFHYLLLLWW